MRFFNKIVLAWMVLCLGACFLDLKGTWKPNDVTTPDNSPEDSDSFTDIDEDQAEQSDPLPDPLEDMDVPPDGPCENPVYVSPEGDDAADGSLEHPVRTVDKALEIAGRDEERYEVRLMEGDYEGEVMITGHVLFSGGWHSDGSFLCDPSLVTIKSYTGRGIYALSTTYAAISCLSVDVEGHDSGGSVYGIMASYSVSLTIDQAITLTDPKGMGMQIDNLLANLQETELITSEMEAFEELQAGMDMEHED